VLESAKLDFLTDLLALLIEEGRRILLFSQFTTMLSLIEAHLVTEHGQRTGAGTVGFLVAVLEHVLHQVEVLAHRDQEEV